MRRGVNNRRGVNRRNKSVAPAVSYNNRTATNIQITHEVPAGASGLVLKVSDLLKEYFQNPQNVRIDSYVIRVNITDTSTAFLAYQVLSVLDDENNAPSVMTNTRPVNINGSVTTVRKPANRRFYVGAQADSTELVIHTVAPKATIVFVDVTTRFHVEKDLVNPLPPKAAVLQSTYNH